jgi:hypothetical protein
LGKYAACVAIQTVPSLWLYGALLLNRRRQQSCVMDQAASAVDFIRSGQLDDRKFRKCLANNGSEKCDTTIWGLYHVQNREDFFPPEDHITRKKENTSLCKQQIE